MVASRRSQAGRAYPVLSRVHLSTLCVCFATIAINIFRIHQRTTVLRSVKLTPGTQPSALSQQWAQWRLLSVVEIVEEIQANGFLKEGQEVAVNVGARDGLEGDPLYPLFMKGFRGLLIEGDPKHEQILLKRFPPSKGHKVSIDFVFPDNIIALLDHAEFPKDLAVFKMDIDSWDCAVIQTMMENSLYRPLLLVMEVNSRFPPPHMFAQLHNRSKTNGVGPGWDYELRGEFCRCSLAYIARIMHAHGYLLLQMMTEVPVGGSDCYWIRSDLAYLFGQTRPRDLEFWYKYQYIDLPHRKSQFSFQEHWFKYWDMSPADAQKQIVQAYRAHTHKNPGQHHPIILGISPTQDQIVS